MMKTVTLAKPETLRLAMVLDQTETIEEISNFFRNQGIAVRSYSVQSDIALRDALKHSPNLIVMQEHSSVTLAHIVSALKQLGNNTPIIVLSNNYSEETVFEHLKNGAMHCAPLQNLHFIEKIVLNEYSNSIARHNSQHLLEKLLQSNKRCDALIDSSKEAIAYIHQGMHIRANSAYMQLFGGNTFDDIEVLSLLDLISAQDVPSFKEMMKKQDKEQSVQLISTHAKTLQGTELSVVVELSPATYEEEDCLQVLIRPSVEESSTNAMIDGAIGCLSRSGFLEEVKKTVTEQEPYILLVCAPETYNELSNKVSLHTLDAVLQNFSTKLKSLLPPQAIVGRLGESSFGVATPLNGHNLLEYCNALYANFKNYLFNTENNSIPLPIKTVGIQWRRPEAALVDSLIAEAIKTFNRTKDRVTIVDTAQRGSQQNMDNQSLEKIVAAIQKERIKTSFAPINSFDGSSFGFYICRFDLLQDDNTSLTLPHTVPEDISLAYQKMRMTHLVQNLAHKQIAHETKFIVPIEVGEDNQWMNDLVQQFSQAHISPSQVVIEFQESNVFTKLKIAQHLAQGFREMGFDIGLGEYGSGEQSSPILQHLKPQWVRFFGNMTNELSQNEDQQKRLKELTDLAHEQGQKVIASEIYDAMGMAVLFAAQIEYAQGEFLAPTIANLP